MTISCRFEFASISEFVKFNLIDKYFFCTLIFIACKLIYKGEVFKVSYLHDNNLTIIGTAHIQVYTHKAFILECF